MQAIINVELDEKVSPMGDVESRFEAVLTKVRRFFTRSIGEIRTAEYEGPDGPVREATAVITFEFHAPKSVVLSACHQLANSFDQECIAVLFSDGEGRLVGREADRWGGFKLEYFKRPSFYELLKEAA